VLLQNKNLWTS